MIKPGESTDQALSCRSLVFVDVDGVLNTTTMPRPRGIHPTLVKRLVSLLWRLPQPCGIVLSSNWRLYDWYFQAFCQALQDALEEASVEEKNTPASSSRNAANNLLENNRQPSFDLANILVGSTPTIPTMRVPTSSNAIYANDDAPIHVDDIARALQRAHEIVQWLDDTYTDKMNLSDDEHTSLGSSSSFIPPQQQPHPFWVSLDDLPLLIAAQEHDSALAQRLKGHVVYVDPESGLTKGGVEQVEQLSMIQQGRDSE